MADGQVTIKAVFDYGDFQKSLGELQGAIEGAGKSSSGASKAFDESKKSTDEMAKGASNATDSLKSLETRMQGISSTTGVFSQALMPAAFAITGLGAAAFKAYADLEDALGATDQIFGSSSGTIKDWADNLELYFGVSEKAAIEYANTFGAMLQNIGGMTESESSKTSQSLVELAADLSATFGGSVEEAMGSLASAMRGNVFQLDKYGIGLNETLLKQSAFDNGITDTVRELSLEERQLAIINEVFEQTAKIQGQAAREADTASGSMRQFKAAVSELATAFGEQLAPIITPIITDLTKLVEWFGNLGPSAQNAIIAFGIISVGGTILLSAISKISGGISTLIGAFGKIGGAVSPASKSLVDVGRESGKASGEISNAGQSAGKSAGQMMAFGFAVLMIAGGISAVILSTTKLVEAFDNVEGSVTEIGIAVGALVLIIGGVVIGIVALGTASTATAPGLLALGFAVLMVSGGIALINLAVAVLVDALTGLVDALSRGFDSIVDSLDKGAEVVDKLGESADRASPSLQQLSNDMRNSFDPMRTYLELVNKIVYAINNLDSKKLSELTGISVNSSGYAIGTASASTGWRLVGENGPEMIRFSGGESVLTAHQSSAKQASIGQGIYNSVTYQIGEISIPANSVRSFVDIINIMENEAGSIQQGFIGG